MKNAILERADLDGVVTVGLNCIDQGIDTRPNVKAAILGHVARHYICIDALREFSVAALDRLHERYGITLEVNDGRLVGVHQEPRTGGATYGG